MIETPEQAAEERKRVRLGMRLVEAYLKAKGTEVVEWIGSEGGHYILKSGKRRLKISEDALGDSGGEGKLTPCLTASLEDFLKGKK